MEIKMKDVQHQMIKLLNVCVNPNSSYLPALHVQAQLLRSNIQQLDEDIVKKLPEISASIISLKPYLDPSTFEEVEKELSVHPHLKEAWEELQEDYNRNVQKFLDGYAAIYRSIHIKRNALADSDLADQLSTAYKQKKKEMNDHLRYINQTIYPRLQELTHQLGQIDGSLKKALEENPFEKAVELLPSKEIISDINKEQPELSAATVGYELGLTVLKGIAEMKNVIDFLDTHDKLKKEVKEVRMEYDKAYAHYRSLQAELGQLKELYDVSSVAAFYYDYSRPFEDKLEEFNKILEKNRLSKYDFLATVNQLEYYLKSLNLIWK